MILLRPLFAVLILSASCLAAESSNGRSFPVADLHQWTITNTGPTKVQANVKDGVMILHWPGGVGQAVIEFKQAVPVREFLHDGFVRYVGQVNILDNVYGSEFDIQLQPIRTDGKRIAPYFRRHAYYGSGGFQIIRSDDPLPYAPPGKFFRVDFNYHVPKVVSAIKPRFVLRGNAITVAIGGVRIQQGLTWERGRPKVPAEPRSFDEKHVEQILKNRPRATPELVRKEGRVALIIDGKDVFPACYTRGPFYPQYTRYGSFTKAGYDIFRINASFGPLSPNHKVGIGRMWRGKDKFDFSKLEHELKVIANINPNAKVIISAAINPYHGWAEEHPDSIVANAKGEKLITNGGETGHYGGEPDYTANREQQYAPSFYGGAFPADAANAVKHLAEFLQTSDVGKIVFEVDFTGGNDGQLYPWDRDVMKGENHSPAAVAAWREYLRSQYDNDVAKLRSAWEDPKASFDQAPVATLAERGFRGMNITRRGTDYNDYLSAGMADFLLGLGKALKQGSNGRLLAGCYYHDSGPNRVLTRHAMGRVMTSPYMDAVRSITWYQMSGSWHRHDKLNWCELDLRPWMPNSMQYFTMGLKYSRQEFQTNVWRYSAMALTDLKGGYYNYDLAETWYTDPEIVKIFGKVRSGLQSALDDSVNIRPAIGIFSDERVPYHLGGNGDYILMRTSAKGLYIAADRSGVPYARYLIDDALDPSFELPKIVILRLPMAITAKEADILRQKAKKSGSVLIWGYGVGELARDHSSILDICGFDATPSKGMRNKQIVAQNAGNLTRGLDGQFLGAPPPVIGYHYRWAGLPYVIRPNPGDIVLGRYAGTNQAGAVLRHKDGLSEIILGRPGAISPQFLRNLAKTVGITPFSTGNDEIRFGSGILAIYADQGGQRSITLPADMTAAASPTGHSFTPTKDGFTFQIGYADTAVFKITKNHHP